MALSRGVPEVIFVPVHLALRDSSVILGGRPQGGRNPTLLPGWRQRQLCAATNKAGESVCDQHVSSRSVDRH